MNFKKAIALGTLITLTVVSSGASTFATEQMTTKEYNEVTKIETLAEESKVLRLTLEEAIQYALEHNKDMIIQDIKIEKQELEYDKNMSHIKKYNKSEKGSDDIPPAIYPAITPKNSSSLEEKYLYIVILLIPAASAI